MIIRNNCMMRGAVSVVKHFGDAHHVYHMHMRIACVTYIYIIRIIIYICKPIIYDIYTYQCFPLFINIYIDAHHVYHIHITHYIYDYIFYVTY